jgi:hypothetical protein
MAPGKNFVLMTFPLLLAGFAFAGAIACACGSRGDHEIAPAA